MTKLVTFLIILLSVVCILASEGISAALTQSEDCPERVHTMITNTANHTEIRITVPVANQWIQNRTDLGLSTTLTNCQCKALGARNTQCTELDDREVDCPERKIAENCGDYADMVMYATYVTTAAAVVIIIVNTILKIVLVKLTKWERPRTVSLYESGLTTKVFIAQFINTAMVVYITNTHAFQRFYNPVRKL